MLVGARFHLPVRDLMPKRAERPEDRGFMHRPLGALAQFEQRMRYLFRGRARSHRYCAGFELALNLWERVHPRRGPRGQSQLPLESNKAQTPVRHPTPSSAKPTAASPPIQQRLHHRRGRVQPMVPLCCFSFISSHAPRLQPTWHRNNWPETDVGADLSREAPRGRRSISQTPNLYRQTLRLPITKPRPAL